MLNQIVHICGFCEKSFVSEANAIKHECKGMIREAQFISLNGQIAWGYYKKWLTLQRRRAVCSGTSFKKSKYFNSFYEFVEFKHKVNIPDVDIYMELMVNVGISPTFWTRDEAYRKYLTHLTYNTPIKTLAEITISTLFDIADVMNVDVSEVFNALEVNDIIQLLRQRTLSPCILLNSSKFAYFYKNRTTAEERTIISTIVDPKSWEKRLNNNKEDVATLKKYVTELGL